MDNYLPSTIDMLGDASAVMFYNQDEYDTEIIKLGEKQKCEAASNLTSDIKIGGADGDVPLLRICIIKLIKNRAQFREHRTVFLLSVILPIIALFLFNNWMFRVIF